MNAPRKLMMVVASLALLLYVVGCTARSPIVRPSDVGPTYVAINGTGATTIDGIEYKYVASAQRKAQIIAGFPKLRIGQSREQVRAALGLPDRAEPMYGKEPYSPLSGWFYQYKIKMRAPGPNMNDVCVQVFFSPTGELEWAIPDHIAGLEEIGSPGGR